MPAGHVRARQGSSEPKNFLGETHEHGWEQPIPHPLAAPSTALGSVVLDQPASPGSWRQARSWGPALQNQDPHFKKVRVSCVFKGSESTTQLAPKWHQTGASTRLM